MKKSIFVILFVILSVFIYADNLNVCICPYNEELANNLQEYLDINVVKTSVKCDNNLLETGDFRLMEYICNESNAQLLLIPIINPISEYNHLRLYSYSLNENMFNLEYEVISSDSSLFSFDIVKTLFNSFFNDYSDVEFKSETKFDSVQSNKPLVIDCKNTIADIYLNDQYLGKTPYVLESYYAPSLIKFCADGFATRVYSISDVNQTDLTVSLIPDNIADSKNFTRSQNKYLISFAATILGWGSRVLVKALNTNNTTLNKVLDYGSWGLAISSSAYLGYNIYNYFKNTQTTAP